MVAVPHSLVSRVAKDMAREAAQALVVAVEMVADQALAVAPV
jgi:hypothetical protein